MRNATKALEKDIPNGFPSDIHWILGIIFYQKEKIASKTIDDFYEVAKNMFNNAFNSFTPGKPRSVKILQNKCV